VRRPFAGLRPEPDLVALREIVPCASAPLELAGWPAGRPAMLVTLLPMGEESLVRSDGTVLVALQGSAQRSSGDPSRDIGVALAAALAGGQDLVDVAPRLHELVDPAAPLAVTVHDGFDFWLADGGDPAPEIKEAFERANAAVPPTARLVSVDAAYWTRHRDRAFLRWVLPHDEAAALDALARLHAARADDLGPGTRCIGSFRTHGLVVPVWELPTDVSVDEYEDPAADLWTRLGDALASQAPLTDAERRARNGLVSRQLTLR
jgi:hypothetical protein